MTSADVTEQNLTHQMLMKSDITRALVPLLPYPHLSAVIITVHFS